MTARQFAIVYVALPAGHANTHHSERKGGPRTQGSRSRWRRTPIQPDGALPPRRLLTLRPDRARRRGGAGPCGRRRGEGDHALEGSLGCGSTGSPCRAGSPPPRAAPASGPARGSGAHAGGLRPGRRGHRGPRPGAACLPGHTRVFRRADRGTRQHRTHRLRVGTAPIPAHTMRAPGWAPSHAVSVCEVRSGQGVAMGWEVLARTGAVRSKGESYGPGRCRRHRSRQRSRHRPV